MNANEKRRRLIIFGGLIGIVFLSIIFIFMSVFNKDTVSLSSNVGNMSNKRIDGSTASPDASEKYNTMIKKHDDNQAEKATETGSSYFSIPINEKQETPPPPPPKEAPKPALEKKEQNKEKPKAISFAQDELKRMSEAISRLDERLNTQITQGAIAFTSPLLEETQVAKVDTASPNTGIDTSATNIFKSGEILYAIIDTALNSDVNSPVMATVVTGKYRLTKFIGTFARYEKRIVIKFDRAVLADGTELSLEAYAIDPNTTEVSVADKVNSHNFSRWGGLIAASFLEGFGEAVANTGEVTTSSTYSSMSETISKNYSLGDQAWIAAGKVGERASEIFANQFNRVPTVYMNMGSAIWDFNFKSRWLI